MDVIAPNIDGIANIERVKPGDAKRDQKRQQNDVQELFFGFFIVEN
jgi:hypothetical protein